MSLALRGLLIAIQFVCPLLFFTDLTRNPYVAQIALLNVGLLAAGCLRWGPQLNRGELSLPRTPLDLPLACWLLLAAATWTLSFFGHLPFFRPAIASEGSRAFQFLLINTFLPFYLAAEAARDCPDEPAVKLGLWVLFAAVFGLLWAGFPEVRVTAPALGAIWEHIWDPYGALVWCLGLAALVLLAKDGTVHHLWHAALCAGFLAAAYSILQYFNMEFIWPRALNPYGGRSVSTFGNPNFMSSYMVMLLPLAAAYALQAKSRFHKAAYSILFLTLEASLLCSLTRSSWVGAAAAVGLLALSPQLRRRFTQDPEFNGAVTCAAVALALFWPQSGMSGSMGVVARFTEIPAIFHAEGGHYSPWHQRNLIWLCCWLMGAENPLLGKGWGLLELFYPFYQGHILSHFLFFNGMRTHANNAHNEILEFWAQTGLLGVGLLFWMWSAFFKSARSFFREDPSPWMAAAVGGIVGMLTDNLMNVSLHFAVPAFLFWWQVGTVMGRLSWRQGWRRELRLPPWGRRTALAALAVLSSWGAWSWVGQFNREAYFFLGFKAAHHGSFGKAVDFLSTAYRWNPHEVNADYEMGNAYARTDQFEKSAWAYGEALRANAGYDEIYYNLAIVQASKLAQRDQAVKNLLTSWAINPLSQPTYDNLAKLLLAEPGRYRAEGILLLEEAVRMFPDNEGYPVSLAYLYGLAGESAKAEATYARVLAAHPNFAAAEANLRAELNRSRHRPPEVLAQVEDYRRLEARIQKKDYGAPTLELARRVAREFPEFHAAWFYLGNLEMQNGGAATGEDWLRRFVTAEPGNVSGILNLAEACRRQGKRTQLIEALRMALRVDPSNAYAAAQLKALGL